MKPFLFSLFLTIAPISNAFALFGGEVGNGGDVIACPGDAPGAIQLFALDNLLAPPVRPLAAVDPLYRVSEKVRVRHPALSDNLFKFIGEIKNEKLTGTNIWSPVHFGLTDIDDEMISEKLPPQCGVGSGTKKQWLQAVVQTVIGSKRYYKYDAGLLSELEKTPLQYSQLLIHEWLWQYADNALQVRLANQFLHEESTGALSSFEFTKFLEDIGLHIPPIGATSAYLVRTEVNERGQLRDRFLGKEHPGRYQAVYIRIVNRSAITYEVRVDEGNGELDKTPQILAAGQTLDRQIPIPTVVFLYDKNGGWPAVQYVTIEAAP